MLRADERRVLLVVDDDPYVRDLIVATLDGRAGVETHAVADGDAAVRAARELRPAAALVDLVLPAGDGLALVDALRADAPGRIAVVGLTALPAASERRRAFDRRCDAVLEKPFDLDHLVASLEVALARVRHPAC